MNPTNFNGSNCVYGASQSGLYQSLPAFKAQLDNPKGEVTFAWKLSLRERLRLVFSGIIWQRVLTFNQPLQPQLLQLAKPDTKDS